MKAYWLGPENEYRKNIKRYAAVYKTLVNKDNDVVVVTDDEKHLAGFSVLSSLGQMTDITFFYVIEEYRRKGYGRFMLSEIEDALRETDVEMLRAMLNEGYGYKELFLKEGYDFFPGAMEYVIRYGALRYSAMYRRHIAGKEAGKAKSIKDLNQSEKKLMSVFLQAMNIPVETGLDREYSIVSINNGKIEAMLLCEKAVNGIIIDVVYSARNDIKDVMSCFRLIDKILDSYGARKNDILLSFAVDGDKNREISRILVGDNAQIGEVRRESSYIKTIGGKGA
ncbi:MAG: GNAT family N-acetyltransferase [Lachnospiraceae bacterium]|nr:GNAT family N-acetyltransferase [Lachnospiraceae bacterium]